MLTLARWLRISAFLWVSLASISANAACPPGPYYCVPWNPVGPSAPPPAPAPAPPAPFKPGNPIYEFKPLSGGSSSDLASTLAAQKKMSPPSAADKAIIQNSLGDRLNLVDSSSYYFAQKANGKRLVFKGSEIKP